jgi:histidine ammonia-lyase
VSEAAASPAVLIDDPLSWQQICAVGHGATLALSARARTRIDAARAIVEGLVARGVRAYGVNTGVGALCDVIVDVADQRRLSRSLLMSHAVGVGAPLGPVETRAIIAAAINNWAHGYSGLRLAVVERAQQLLNGDCLPEVPAGGSVGYLTHMAHVALVLVGGGFARVHGRRLPGIEALQAIGAAPLVLEAKEGLSLINGTPCATGLSALGLDRAERLLQWADAIGAMTFENLRGQMEAFSAQALARRVSPGLATVGERLRVLLSGSAIVQAAAGRRTQDPLSLRAIPHVHGAARDVFAFATQVVNRELASVTDNPIVTGTLDAPIVSSEAHAVGAGIGLAMDSLAIAVATVGAMSERRIDRLVNPLVSNLPAFLSAVAGVGSGFMIAQYTAASLVAENRRLAAPASLDGGVTSGLQEDYLCHATPAALKALRILDNAEHILAIELLATAQAYDLQPGPLMRAPRTDQLYQAVRGIVPSYRDDRPLAHDIDPVRDLFRTGPPCEP